MSTVVSLLMALVLVGWIIGMADIIRDLWLDNMPYSDPASRYSWEMAPVSRLTPTEAFFLQAYDPRIDEDMVEFIDGPTRGLMTFGFNEQDLKRILSSAVAMEDSEDSIEPLYVDVRSTILAEIDSEYRAKSFAHRQSLSEEAALYL